MRGERERGPALSVLAASGRWSQSGHAVAKVRGPAQISELIKDFRGAKSRENTAGMRYGRGLTVNAKIYVRQLMCIVIRMFGQQ